MYPSNVVDIKEKVQEKEEQIKRTEQNENEDVEELVKYFQLQAKDKGIKLPKNYHKEAFKRFLQTLEEGYSKNDVRIAIDYMCFGNTPYIKDFSICVFPKFTSRLINDFNKISSNKDNSRDHAIPMSEIIALADKEYSPKVEDCRKEFVEEDVPVLSEKVETLLKDWYKKYEGAYEIPRKNDDKFVSTRDKNVAIDVAKFIAGEVSVPNLNNPSVLQLLRDTGHFSA